MTYRVRVTDSSSGIVKLETRIPAGFLAGLYAIIPSVKGLNVEVGAWAWLGGGGAGGLPGGAECRHTFGTGPECRGGCVGVGVGVRGRGGVRLLGGGAAVLCVRLGIRASQLYVHAR